MGILDRMSRVVRANINDLLDSAEDPEKLYDQHIADMQESLREAKGKVLEVAAQEKLCRHKLEARNADAVRWHARATAAVEAGDDDLARKALGVRRGVLNDVAELERQVAVQTDYTTTLKESLAALERRVVQAKDEQKRFKVDLATRRMRDAARRQAPGGPRPIDTSALHDASNFEVFDRMQDKVDLDDFEADALREVEAAVRPEEDEAALEARFSELSQARQTDDDLAELKRKLDEGT